MTFGNNFVRKAKKSATSPATKDAVSRNFARLNGQRKRRRTHTRGGQRAAPVRTTTNSNGVSSASAVTTNASDRTTTATNRVECFPEELAVCSAFRGRLQRIRRRRSSVNIGRPALVLCTCLWRLSRRKTTVSAAAAERTAAAAAARRRKISRRRTSLVVTIGRRNRVRGSPPAAVVFSSSSTPFVLRLTWTTDACRCQPRSKVNRVRSMFAFRRERRSPLGGPRLQQIRSYN